MEEKTPDGRFGASPEIKSEAVEKISNFWYYCKWHTIVALFVIFVVAVCSLQMCTKGTVDAYIMYAGPSEVSRRHEGGDIPEYNKLMAALEAYVSDYDGDGKTVISLSTLFALSDEEIAEVEREEGVEVNETLLKEDAATLKDRLYVGEYYVCLLSPSVYDTYNADEDVSLFCPVAEYADGAEGLLYYDEFSVVLSSTPLYKNSAAVREILPADTVVVLRIKSAIASVFGGSENDERFERSEEIFKNILGAK
jgi:hypothetical protein